ncbi:MULTISPECIES: 4-oxalomesaconate tautomerase [Arthrobacter]|uniref:4-oxalomesaconate tautomerase n=1 Tax=Arthrobacter TaxID=1663 RepID=UPI001D147A6C|nr:MULTISPECIES: 4-oxalomesaconate tautomerase [Arthrobacter]MCC3284155.1 4-oxalomesaconate tautomerase [Arthrobacter caoxuetaonis]MCC9194608.1 4-oxalomesaconate tautomerase [Arthrobacter sp. zg-Y916]
MEQVQGAAGPAPGQPAGNQVGIPCMFMRGGTSRGPFFAAGDLPQDTARRDAVLRAVMGSPHPLQIDGMGGGNPLTSKAGIVSVSRRPGIDLEFLFAQLRPDTGTVDTTPNCGNMLAAVLPFAVERGLLEPHSDTTTAAVLTLNTGMVAEISIRTPLGDGARYVDYDGDTRIDGVPGTSSPVTINFLDTAGSVCDQLLPTGRARNTVHLDGSGEVAVTCIDNGQPLVIVEAAALGRSGYEDPAALNADGDLKDRLEQLRLACGHLMGLGDVSAKNYPKMTLVSAARSGGTLNTRSFIPHVCHESIGVLAAVTAATACVIEGTVAQAVAGGAPPPGQPVSVEHPAGEFTVELGLDPQDPQRVTRSALLRTARLIMAGTAYVPRAVWQGPSGEEHR